MLTSVGDLGYKYYKEFDLNNSQLPVVAKTPLQTKFVGTKSAVAILNNASVPAGGSVESAVVDASQSILEKFVLTVRLAFGTGSTAGVSLNLLTSPNGSMWDTEASDVTPTAPSFQAGVTKQKSYPITLPAAYFKLVVVNADTSVAHTVSAWVVVPVV